MLRKIFLITISIASINSFAQPYLGLGVGPEFINFKTGAHVFHAGDFDVKNNSYNAASGVFGTLFLGYGWDYKRYYFAGEFNANASSSDYSNSNDEYVHHNFTHTTFTIDKNFGLSFIPGIHYSLYTLFYARIGYTVGNFKIVTNDLSLGNVNKYLNGLRFGFGVQNDLTQHLTARIEYSQVNYQKVTANTLDAGSGVAKETNITPQTGQVEFGIAYRFV